MYFFFPMEFIVMKNDTKHDVFIPLKTEASEDRGDYSAIFHGSVTLFQSCGPSCHWRCRRIRVPQIDTSWLDFFFYAVVYVITNWSGSYEKHDFFDLWSAHIVFWLVNGCLQFWLGSHRRYAEGTFHCFIYHAELAAIVVPVVIIVLVVALVIGGVLLVKRKGWVYNKASDWC